MMDRWAVGAVGPDGSGGFADVAEAQLDLVEMRYLSVPIGIRSFRLPNGHRTPTDLPALVIRLTDGAGAQGFSLLWFQQPSQVTLVGAGLRYLGGEMTTGIRDLAGLDRALDAATRFIGEHGVAAFAASGLRMAFEDLICRRRRVSLADLVGRRRDRVGVYRTGLMLQSSIDELVQEAEAGYAEGFRAMKMLVGKPDLEEDVDRIQAVRGCLPADVVLMVDALQGWDGAETALRAAERFESFGLKWIEDPIRQQDVSGYRELAQRSPVPIATGETLFDQADIEELVEAGVPYIVGEPERVGGLRAWMRTADRVGESGATMLPHLYPHVSVQMLATLRQDEVWLEYVPWFDHLAVEKLSIGEDGTIGVDAGPGAGFTPCPDALDRMAWGPWTRIDGR